MPQWTTLQLGSVTFSEGSISAQFDAAEDIIRFFNSASLSLNAFASKSIVVSPLIANLQTQTLGISLDLRIRITCYTTDDPDSTDDLLGGFALNLPGIHDDFFNAGTNNDQTLSSNISIIGGALNTNVQSSFTANHPGGLQNSSIKRIDVSIEAKDNYGNVSTMELKPCDIRLDLIT